MTERRFIKGDDHHAFNEDHGTWGICDTQAPQPTIMCSTEWMNRIEVYGPDAKLRDTILGLLNGEVVKT